jgi:hypothetical protein
LRTIATHDWLLSEVVYPAAQIHWETTRVRLAAELQEAQLSAPAAVHV